MNNLARGKNGIGFEKWLLQSVFVLAVLLSSSLAKAALPEGISVQIKPVKTEFVAADTVLLEITYTNTTAAAIKILKWNTALEGRINSDFLRIYLAGTQLQYSGRMYKRGTPSASDFISLQPGQNVSATVDVGDGYDVIAAGRYNVSYSQLQAMGAVSLRKQISPTVTFTMLEDRHSALFKRQPTFESCSVSRRQVLDSALSAAENIAIKARNDLAATPVASRSGALRYREWFGSVTSNRWSTVQNHFNNIADATSNRTINFDCSCTDNFFAYVFPSQPYDVYLCNVFWLVPLTGTDSKAGTIIHELSHFNVVANTDDHVYGQSGARSLAVGNPNLAVLNADSHEYFSENTPFLTMPDPVTPPGPDPDPIIPDPEPEPEPEPEPPIPVIAPILQVLIL